MPEAATDPFIPFSTLKCMAHEMPDPSITRHDDADFCVVPNHQKHALRLELLEATINLERTILGLEDTGYTTHIRFDYTNFPMHEIYIEFRSANGQQRIPPSTPFRYMEGYRITQAPDHRDEPL